MSLIFPSVAPAKPDSIKLGTVNIEKIEGHKNLSFNINIPKDLLSPKWAVVLTPQLLTSEKNISLPEIVINGEEFKLSQDSSYIAYNDYVTNTIDSTLYKEAYINHEQLKSDIEHMHDVYWQYYYDEWDNQIKYELWKSKMSSGTKKYFFPAVRKSYEDQIRSQYELRIKIQKQRYLKANLDTTGIYDKYMKESASHIKKLPRYSVIIDSIKTVPKEFKAIHQSGRTLDDITQAMWDLLNKHESALMNLPAFDYDKIRMNEKRKFLVSKIFNFIVKFPYHTKALLDTTIIDYNNDFQYLYNCPNVFTDYLSDTIQLKLHCRVIAMDETVYNTESQNTINYIFEGKKLLPPIQINNKLEVDSISNWFE